MNGKKKEFNYASVTAYQAMEDRARISSFYYILLGVLASGLAAVIQLSKENDSKAINKQVRVLEAALNKSAE